MMRHKVFLMLFFITVSALNPIISICNDLEFSKSLTQKGISYLLNFEFDQAQKYLNDAIKHYPENPQPYISKSALPLWRFLFSKSKTDYNEAIALIDQAIEHAEKFYSLNKKSSFALTNLGIAYGNRVFLKIRDENYLGAILDLRKSYSALSEAIKLNPENYDAYFGLGLYHYSIGSLPKTLKWVVSLLGFDGNIEKGLREIELAAEKGVFQKIEAAFYLTQLYPWSYGDFDKAEKILNDLLTQYPNNQIFLYTRSVFRLNRNNTSEALKDLLTIQSQKSHPIPKLLSFSKYRIGECYFRLQNYNKAIEFYEEFIKEYREEVYLPQAVLNTGISLEFTNRRNEAIEYYSKAINSKSRYGDDQFAIERARRFLNQKIDEVDSLLIVARNLHKSGKYMDAVYLYDVKLKSRLIDPERRAEIYYYLGECFYDVDRLSEAKTAFEKIIDMKDIKLPWIEPWSKYYLGQIYLRNGNKETARKFFKDVLNYKNYQNERWLRYRTERNLKLIE